MTFKKGQAAMEFLMTYGWAILAAIIAIGVLAYFGVFSPGRVAGDSTTVGAPFFVDAAAINETPGLAMELIQNSGGTVEVTLINSTGNTGINCEWVGSNNVTSGTLTTFHLTCSGGTLSVGDSYSSSLKIEYQEQGSNLVQSSQGSLRETTI